MEIFLTLPVGPAPLTHPISSGLSRLVIPCFSLPAGSAGTRGLTPPLEVISRLTLIPAGRSIYTAGSRQRGLLKGTRPYFACIACEPKQVWGSDRPRCLHCLSSPRPDHCGFGAAHAAGCVFDLPGAFGLGPLLHVGSGPTPGAGAYLPLAMCLPYPHTPTHAQLLTLLRKGRAHSGLLRAPAVRLPSPA